MNFRLSMILFCLLLFGDTVRAASTCTSVRSQPDVWVSEKVDALVRAARAAYEDDDAIPAYGRVLDGITTTLKRCTLSQDAAFISRYRNLVEYIETVSLDRQPDHELGFI